MDIKQMKYFLEICKAGNISKAARGLYISQQGLSSAIHNLETELKCDLFYRKGNDIVLTDQGKYFFKEAESIVDAFDQLQNHFLFSNEDDNLVSVICIHNLLTKGFPALKQYFINHDDDINISMGECYSDECASYLESGNCAFAICYDTGEWGKDYEIYPLFKVEHCFIVRTDNPLALFDEISLSQLDGQRMIYPQKRTAIAMQMDRMLEKADIKPNILFRSNQALQISDFVHGDSELIARTTVADAATISNPNIKVLRLKDFDFVTDAVLVQVKGRQLTEAEKKFKKNILDLSLQ